jgi:hypothetical protein
MMVALGTSETSVDIYLTTWQYIPEDSELHTRRHENLKSHIGRQCLITNYEWLNLITANHVSAQEKKSQMFLALLPTLTWVIVYCQSLVW